MSSNRLERQKKAESKSIRQDGMRRRDQLFPTESHALSAATLKDGMQLVKTAGEWPGAGPHDQGASEEIDVF